jgi:hypothetical protein
MALRNERPPRSRVLVMKIVFYPTTAIISISTIAPRGRALT